MADLKKDRDDGAEAAKMIGPHIQAVLSFVQSLFKDGVKVMLVAYTPGEPNKCMVAGDGDAEEVISTIRYAQANGVHMKTDGSRVQ